MELSIALGLGGWALLFVGALVIGVVAQWMGRAEMGYEWLVTLVAAFLGGLVASEFIVQLRTFEPVWDGLALVPAIVGGLLVGGVAEVVTRISTGGTFMDRPMSA
jgi:uncharacterized membrane protein YeaQ/YmgE (transglycosylase-associated protein family)